MISKRNIVKLVAVVAIVIIGAVYWYLAEKRTSPLEQVEQATGTQQ